VIERPNTIKNGLIAKIKNNNVECYGQTQGSTFKSFERIKKPNTSVIIDIHEAPETLNRDLKNVVLG
jgi:hypothetical protein